VDGSHPITFEDTAMPFTAAQLVTGASYSLATYQKKDPIDQVNFQHATLDWLVKNKEVSTFGNGSFKEPIYIANGSNYQNYFGADQVTYNERDPAKWTDFQYFNNHDGFWFDEDRLAAAGIFMADDSDTGSMPTATEQASLIDLLKVSYSSLKSGIQEQLSYEVLRDGSQSTKAAPGMQSLVSKTPTVGTVGGLNAATYTYWRNNANLGIAAANLIDQMEITWRACLQYGGMIPDFIPCGAAFLDVYRQQAGLTINRRMEGPGVSKGGVSFDASVTAVYFKGIQLVWDPTFEALDTLLGTTTQTKTCYFLNSKSIKLRPLKGNWMVDRKPERLPDRYVHYFGQTSKYGFTTNKRNALAVLTIA
jgi:hypothetical protein